MNLQDLKFEKIQSYDPSNSRAKCDGYVDEWVARNEWGNVLASGHTLLACIKEAKHFIRTQTK